MSEPIHRRRFLQYLNYSAAWGVAACSGLFCGASAARAVEPISRSGTPKFKFSLAAYSYRKLLSGKDPALTLHDFVDDCARLQIDGTELTSYYFPSPLSDEYLLDLKQHCFVQGLDVSGTAVGNDFGFPPGERRQQELDKMKRWIEHAATLGAPVIRVFAGHVKADSTPEETHRLMVEGLEESCAHAARHGVFLALENHGGPTSTADGLLALVRDVKSPWFGVNLDTGNFHTDDIYGDLERAAPYALNVQVKVVVSGPDRKKRPTDYPRLAKILRNAGYRGYIVLEYEEAEDPREACPSHIDQLREAFA